MKKAQTTVEYVLFILITTMLLVLVTFLWNRDAIIHGSTFGVETEDNAVHVRPMSE